MTQTAECVLCDWAFNPADPPLAVYWPDVRVPLRWDRVRLRTVRMDEGVAESVPYVALAAHWAVEHPAEFHDAAGDTEVSMGLVRS